MCCQYFTAEHYTILTSCVPGELVFSFEHRIAPDGHCGLLQLEAGLVLLLFRERNLACAERFRLWRRRRQMHVQWVAQPAQIVLDLRDLPLDVVVLGQIDARLLGRLVQRDQMLAVFHVR
uniref:Uncharacterized protein n=1 Tax=Anopheles melas TaxID=34690 RepID=A0A182U615_9DIPT